MPTSDNPPRAGVQDRHYARLKAFVLRARRIEAHSLAADLKALVRVARTDWQFTIEDGRCFVTHKLPPEEQVESAAARVRPLLLQGEDCYYGNVLNALGYLSGTQEDRDWVKQSRREWDARVLEKTTSEDGYRLLVTDVNTGQSADLDNLSLAMAWIYGDVIHHDAERLRAADLPGLQERYRAAAPLVAWVMLSGIRLLRKIQALQAKGTLAIAEEVFTQPVVLETTTIRQEANVYTAPAGTPSPTNATTPLGDAWKPLRASADAEGEATP